MNVRLRDRQSPPFPDAKRRALPERSPLHAKRGAADRRVPPISDKNDKKTMQTPPFCQNYIGGMKI